MKDPHPPPEDFTHDAHEFTPERKTDFGSGMPSPLITMAFILAIPVMIALLCLWEIVK